jgi:hypothetical protein
LLQDRRRLDTGANQALAVNDGAIAVTLVVLVVLFFVHRLTE